MTHRIRFDVVISIRSRQHTCSITRAYSRLDSLTRMLFAHFSTYCNSMLQAQMGKGKSTGGGQFIPGKGIRSKEEQLIAGLGNPAQVS
jgi:hypothetical protein